MQEARIRHKGQITLPVEVRRDLGVQEGDIIYFERRGDETVLVRAEDIVDRLAGSLSKYVQGEPLEWNRDELWREIASERDERSMSRKIDKMAKNDTN